MKKVIALFLVSTLVLTSCSNDDEPSNVTGDIVGTWIATDLTYEGTLETTFLGQPIEGTFFGEAYDITNTLTFNEVPNTLVSEGSYSLTVTYTIGGITETKVIEDLEFFENTTWELNGNQLILESSDEDTAVSVYTLTDNKLVIGIVTVEETENNGIPVTSTINAVASFKR